MIEATESACMFLSVVLGVLAGLSAAAYSSNSNKLFAVLVFVLATASVASGAVAFWNEGYRHSPEYVHAQR